VVRVAPTVRDVDTDVSPDGRYVAVLGEHLVIADTATGDQWALVTDIEVTETAWRDDTTLVLTGRRDAADVVAELDVETGNVTEP
jgi:hypothetical protein